MERIYKLRGNKCGLGPCCSDDAGLLTRWLNDMDVAIPLGEEAYTVIGQEFILNQIGEIQNGNQCIFTIFDISSGSAIGRCMLFNIDVVNRNAMLGILIGDQNYWGKGFGREAVELMLDYAFGIMNLDSIMLGTYEFNTRAIACYKKAGFQEIGRRRNARIIGHQYFDIILMDILADEYQIKYLQLPGLVSQEPASISEKRFSGSPNTYSYKK